MKSIHLIAAARPNFMKIAPLYHALKKTDWAEPVIVHTGQHYDLNMSDAFFKDLLLPEPHHHLGVGSGSHAEQTGKVMIAYEKLLLEHRPVLVVVVGDVNSTVACTLAAVKLGVKTAHLEAGLRSFDRTMPEEINRIVTDSIADILWTPSPDGDEDLLREGVAPEKIERVGNIMIDSLRCGPTPSGRSRLPRGPTGCARPRIWSRTLLLLWRAEKMQDRRKCGTERQRREWWHRQKAFFRKPVEPIRPTQQIKADLFSLNAPVSVVNDPNARNEPNARNVASKPNAEM
jgi:UDP-N-acetylglucosamine 2-epimerase (non-hydrolysing)